MTKIKGLVIGAVFLAGCAVGGASSRFVVPPASAQQAATLTKWEYLYVEVGSMGAGDKQSQAAGMQGWEMVQFSGSYMIFKRPKM